MKPFLWTFSGLFGLLSSLGAFDQGFETDLSGVDPVYRTGFGEIPSQVLFRVNPASPGNEPVLGNGSVSAFEGDWFMEVEFVGDTAVGVDQFLVATGDRAIFDADAINQTRPFISGMGRRTAFYIDDPEFQIDPDGIPNSGDENFAYNGIESWYWQPTSLPFEPDPVPEDRTANSGGGFGVSLVETSPGDFNWRARADGNSRGYDSVSNAYYQFANPGWYIFETVWVADIPNDSVDQVSRIYDASENLLFEDTYEDVTSSISRMGGLGPVVIGNGTPSIIPGTASLLTVLGVDGFETIIPEPNAFLLPLGLVGFLGLRRRRA